MRQKLHQNLSLKDINENFDVFAPAFTMASICFNVISFKFEVYLFTLSDHFFLSRYFQSTF